MTETMSFGARELFILHYGPMDLVSLDDITLSVLEQLRPHDARWARLGLRLDPREQCRNEYEQVWRSLRVFWAWYSLHAEVDWRLDLDGIASRIFLCDGPVVIGMWEHVAQGRAGIAGNEEPGPGRCKDEDEHEHEDEDPHL